MPGGKLFKFLQTALDSADEKTIREAPIKPRLA